MSDNGTTESNQNPPTPSSENTPPAQPPVITTPPVTQNAQSALDGASIKALTDTISALPETIARSVKEAIGTPKTAASPSPESKTETKSADSKGDGAGSTSHKESAPSADVPGKRKSFADWWFNG